MTQILHFLENDSEREYYLRIIDRIKNNLSLRDTQFNGLTEYEINQIKQRYSRFMDCCIDGFCVNSKHIIKKLHCPKGWFHYLFNLKHEIGNNAVSAVAQDGAGVLSLDSVLFGAISKLNGNENYMHVSQVYRNTRNIWIKNEAGCVHSLCPQPFLLDASGKFEANDYADYLCEQGAGYTMIHASRDGLQYNFRIFIPRHMPGEIWTITVKNIDKRQRWIHLYPEINFGLDSHPNHYFVGMAVSEAEYDPDNHSILAKNLDFKNAFPRWGAFISDRAPLSFESDGDLYYRFGASIIYPPALFDPSLSNTEAKQPLKGLIGTFQFKIHLQPDEEEKIHLALVAVDPGKNVKNQIKKWKHSLKDGFIEHEFENVTSSWNQIFQSFLIKTPSCEMDRTFNTWGKYQSILCSRFNSPYDMGTRDMFQYLLANCVFEPDYVKLMIPCLLSYQYHDGRIPRQISKFSDLHDLRNFMDCQLWMHDPVNLYIKETGDFDILDEKIGFLEDDHKTRSARYERSVYDHLMLAIQSAYDHNLGRHGLCKLGYGGWNDALDGLRGNESESVWLSELLVYAARKMKEIAEYRENTITIEYLDSLIRNLTDAINTKGWDKKEYYIFGYDNQGNRVGSSWNNEGSKHLNENAWAILSQVSPPERIPRIIKAMEELGTPFGPRLLLPYSHRSVEQVGRIADQAKGHFENGSVYQHGVLFWAIALQRTNIDEAFRIFSGLTNDNRVPDISTNPMTYHSNYTAVPDNDDYGKEPYYPFSGSHTWRMRFIIEMMGLKPGFDHIAIDPAIPACWRNQVKNGELICKARKKSNRREHHHIIYNAFIYRDDSIGPDNKRVTVNDDQIECSEGQFILMYSHPVFTANGSIEIKIYL